MTRFAAWAAVGDNAFGLAAIVIGSPLIALCLIGMAGSGT